uniref:type IX secretion system periplasmic lipoprotein PorW/SprE n=1 Tax=Pararhodonellum marinum TaxID=2755358 RepID=UPI00293BE452|nr:gliding motility protein [Pararhodonellum marinum]
MFFLVMGIWVFSSCSSEKNTFTNRMFHNVTAKYNAYFLASQKIAEVERSIALAHKEDYTQILPVFYPIDSAVIEQQEAVLEEAREMASKAIDWHRISKWKDDSYFLIGLVDYYNAEFDEAINTFKYLNVNSKKDDIRHAALIQLFRAFTDLKKYEDATYVVDFLSKETKISDENRQKLYKTLAYYYEQRQDKNGLITSLNRAIELTNDVKEKSRINFILGQLYQREGLDAISFNFYQEALKGNPPYERTFFAQLYSQQVAELNKSKDFRKVRKYYEDLYNNSKNRALRDVVLFERAMFEINQGELEEGIRFLTLAAREEGGNPKQKAYIYQKLAEIAYTDKKNYRASKFYLDSALTHVKQGDNLYLALNERKTVLDNYVLHYDRISKNDSLIALSKLSPEEQELVADAFILAEEERLMREAEEKATPQPTNIFSNLLAFGGSSGGGSSFYFDNSLAIQQGAIEFSRIWGSRRLQDNWRRGSSMNLAVTEEVPQNRPDSATEVVDDIEETPLALPDKNDLLANIPRTPADMDILNQELEESYFELGKLLFFDLNEPQLTIDYLEKFISNFPTSLKKPETYYTLYLAHKDLGSDFQKYSLLLNSEYPGSPFTASINNPDLAPSTQSNRVAASAYREAYENYVNKSYETSRQIIRGVLENYPLTQHTDRLLLLDIMVAGKIEPQEIYQEKLEAYIQTTKDKDLNNMAKKMLAVILGEPERETFDLVAELPMPNEADIEAAVNATSEDQPSEEGIYKLNLNLTHIFVLVIEPQEASAAKNLTGDLENFHSQSFPNARLRTGNLSFTREQTIIIVSPFSNAERALSYQKTFLANFNPQGVGAEFKKNTFVISIENFQQLNKRKNLAEYLVFYSRSYK